MNSSLAFLKQINNRKRFCFILCYKNEKLILWSNFWMIAIEIFFCQNLHFIFQQKCKRFPFWIINNSLIQKFFDFFFFGSCYLNNILTIMRLVYHDNGIRISSIVNIHNIWDISMKKLHGSSYCCILLPKRNITDIGFIS